MQQRIDGQAQRIGDLRADEGRIHPFLPQIVDQLDGPAFFQRQGDQRVAVTKRADDARNKGVKRRGAGEANGDAPLLAARGAARGGEGMVDMREDGACVGQQGAAGIGDFDAARLPAQQLHAEFALQRAESAG